MSGRRGGFPDRKGTRASRSVQYSPPLGWLTLFKQTFAKTTKEDGPWSGVGRPTLEDAGGGSPSVLSNRLTSKPSHTPRLIKSIIRANLDKLYSTMKHPSRVYLLKFYLISIWVYGTPMRTQHNGTNFIRDNFKIFLFSSVLPDKTHE